MDIQSTRRRASAAAGLAPVSAARFGSTATGYAAKLSPHIKLGSQMRSVLWATAASFVIYNAILALFGSGTPSAASYLYGLALFVGPFLVLLLAARVGLTPFLSQLSAGVGLLFVAIVGLLAATRQATFVAPTFLLVFGVISFVVLLLAVTFRVFRSAVNRVKRT